MFAFSSRPLAAGRRRAAFCITSVIIGQFFSAAVWGQTTFGTFVGTVRDPSGAAITTAIASRPLTPALRRPALPLPTVLAATRL